MSLVRHHGGWVIVASLALALTLTALPLPAWAQFFRPDWVTLVLIYWCLALPSRVGVGIAWVAGLFTDAMTGTLMGQHALGMAVVAYLTVQLHQRIRVYPLRQQAVTVLLFLLLKQLISLWVMGFTGREVDTSFYFAASLTGMLLWPWIFFILRDLRRRFRVN